MGGVRMGVEGRGGGARVGRAVASGGVRGRGAKGLWGVAYICGVAYRWWHIGGVYVGWHIGGGIQVAYMWDGI